MLIGMGLAGTATAQERTQLGGEPTSPQDIRVLHEFSRCAARQETTRARSILAMDFRSAEYQRRLRGVAYDSSNCLPPGGVLAFSYMLFAGGMAESLLRLQSGADELAARVAYDPARPAIRARDESEMVFLCTVRAAPQQVAALLRTEAASDRETALLGELTEHAGRCLPEGSRMGLNRVGLRALLALAAYRLSEHNLRTASR
ncbi:MAG TPA: hypothetical protein VJS15_00080 [Allosphingosinicella sp.]|nr:hypothetical protein [Allosphingosinicella sp.]